MANYSTNEEVKQLLKMTKYRQYFTGVARS